jgi:hypothetical protein
MCLYDDGLICVSLSCYVLLCVLPCAAMSEDVFL